ncbi:MAG TPA: amino acid permease, partial [Candidatus Tripitaka californicus]|uniref:amino acid permease n=1 Tax=Candidatus Tripitaka californicus TaxID=3367616 RepID=UPI004028E1EB
LKKVLDIADLIVFGVGSTVGAGIFVLSGIAANQHAGPGVTISFAFSSIACALAALCYAEFATLIPLSGSVYTYSYAAVGELMAWIIGWDLILEYGVGSGAVAIGWSGYLRNLLQGFGIQLPAWASSAVTTGGGGINLPAVIIILLVTGILILGIKESSIFNMVMVGIKLSVIFLLVGVGSFWVQPENWSPIAPFGWGGVLTGASLVFFAYIGFDGLTTIAEETHNPRRDLPIGLLASLGICTAIYIAVALVLTGMVYYKNIDITAPLANACQATGYRWMGPTIAVGCVVGLGSVLMGLMLGQSRVFFAMSRDGLLPGVFSRVHHRFRTPWISTLIVGGAVATAAGLLPIETVAHLTNIGTIFAFMLISISVIILRYKRPDLHRPFRCPGVPAVPILSIIFCIFLLVGLPVEAWIRFGIWLAIGFVVYFAYGFRKKPVHTHQIEGSQDLGH